MQRILIVTDSLKELADWQRALVQAGYPVGTCAGSRENLMQALMPRPPDIFLLDGSAAQLTPKELRSALSEHFPSHEMRLIWLATGEQAARLDPASGLDDFLVLPASAAELLARIRLLLWRTHRVDGADLLLAGDLVIDQANYSVSAGGQALELTFKEYELLRFLVSHRGRVFTREALLNQVWGYDYFGGTRTVDVHIRRIRAKLGPEREELIETVRNVGYKFNAGD
jgi:DNA-binding response OmpR family regulator